GHSGGCAVRCGRSAVPGGHARRRSRSRSAAVARPVPVLRAGRGRAAMRPLGRGRMLDACGGSVFPGDDGFGVEVARRLAGTPLPEGVEVKDIGIRGVHLAYDLLDGCDLLILVDAAARGEVPGTVSVIEVGTPAAAAAGLPVIDAHGLAPDD